MPRLTDLADQEDVLRGFRSALGRVRTRAVRSLHRNSRKAQMILFALFERQRFADTANRTRPLGPISARWRQAKIRMGLDPRRGHAGGGLAKTIGLVKAVSKDNKGFTYDIVKASAQVRTSRGRRSRGRRSRGGQQVATYIRFYERKKAPGIGSFPKAAIDLLDEGVQEDTRDMLSRIRGSALKPGKGFAVDLNLTLGGL